jgi:hypothetical protein
VAKKARKRRRRRDPSAAPPASPERAREPVRHRTARDEPPPAPWGSFPLVELTVLVALVLLLVGFFASGARGVMMIGAGITLGSLAGLELSIREHLSGYRSHTLILAGVPAIVTLAALFALADSLSPALRLAIGVAVFGAGLWLFTAVFRRRSGGVAFRIRGFRG